MSVRPTIISSDPLHPFVHALDSAFNYAFTTNRDPKLTYLDLQGMSGWRYRVLINKLVSLLPSCSYLEVGSWMGSTLCSAIADNKVRAVAIDNWSQFGGPKDSFLENLAKFRSSSTDVTFLEQDFRKVNFGALGRFEVYLFDGPHEEQDQYDGIAMALPALEDDFILVVDDWNHHPVPAGTRRALQLCGLTILHSIEIRTTLDGTHPELHSQNSEWHNGYFISVLRKPNRCVPFRMP
jgi:Methyltransferase domain